MPDTFRVTYLLTIPEGQSPQEHIRAIQLEQSAELPDHVVRAMDADWVTGSVIHQQSLTDRQVQVTIAWPAQNHGGDITQFLNILFGNISLKQGIIITGIHWEDVSPGLFEGPDWGIDRIREEWDIPERALSCTALKPMGYKTNQLADLVYRFALGGIDIIKDDHGITNQQTAPFRDRVTECVLAAERASQKTGRRSRYFPNITGDPHQVTDRYKMAYGLGADGVLVCPMLTGPALMHQLARSSTDLPIMAHPAFSGTLVARETSSRNRSGERNVPGNQNASGSQNEFGNQNTSNSQIEPGGHGFEAGLFYGGLWRALGADFVIYPNTGGRFSYTQETCESINREARRRDRPFAPSFPVPAGGMQHEKMSHWLDNYGTETTFLIGGSLYENPADIETASKAFTEILR